MVTLVKTNGTKTLLVGVVTSIGPMIARLLKTPEVKRLKKRWAS